MSDWEKDYPELNLDEDELDPDSSLAKMLPLIGNGKRIVDFGCATGYFAKLLRDRDCTVVGIEINAEAAKVAEQHCEKVIVADLDFAPLVEILPNEQFDVAVFGDVLEHLRDPWALLKQVHHILKPNGYLVASIPNISHGAIRLALLQGHFDYAKLGILDNTHLRFFTRDTVIELFEKTGYIAEICDRTTLPIFSTVNYAPILNPDDFRPEVVQELEQQPDTTTLQFILQAFPAGYAGRLQALTQKYPRLLVEQDNLKQSLATTQAELAEIRTQAQQFWTELQQSQADLRQSQVDLLLANQQLEEYRAKFDQTWKEAQELAVEFRQAQQINADLMGIQIKFNQSQAELYRLQLDQETLKFRADRFHDKVKQQRETIARLRQELQDARNEVEAMKTSKFWKIRGRWFKVKRLFGLKEN